MKKTKWIKSIVVIIGIAMLYGMFYLGYESGYDNGHDNGVDMGSEMGIRSTLDTMMTIMNNQIGNHNYRSKLVINDTNIYYLSPGTIKLKEPN